MRIKKLNRNKSRMPKGDKSFWCLCDRYLVSEGQRCHICKGKTPTKRSKLNRKNFGSMCDLLTAWSTM